LKSLRKDCYNVPFSHIYVERNVWGHPRAKRILERFSNAVTIEIEHYKDVFCRARQDVALQNETPMLIIASKAGQLVYEGAPVCQSFGNEYFYYTSCLMNCIYSCDYCYLKGMYPSGNLVVFVNLEDTFAELEAILARHEVYLCVSYDTDLMALEDLTGFVEDWVEFCGKHPGLKIEIRTKCGRIDLWDKLSPKENVIFAFTLSPEEVRQKYEHRTSPLADRIVCADMAMRKGFLVRLCFDPILYCTNWRTTYQEMLYQVAGRIDMERLYDVSVGSFRIPQDYLKKLRRVMPGSAAVQFPFENDAGVYHYPKELMEEMEQTVVSQLQKWIPKEKIFGYLDIAEGQEN